MTADDAETAAYAFVEAVQRVGTAGALAEVEDQVRAQTYEEIARRLEGESEHAIARMVRDWRWRR